MSNIDKIAPFAKPIVLALLIAAGVLVAQHYFENEQLRILAQREATEGVLGRAACAESVFQEVTVVTADGGLFRCGAVRDLPVDKDELARWYQKEARRWLEASGKGK